jgi:hypothetical protein
MVHKKLIIFFIFFFCCSLAFSETIVLNNGRVIKGEIGQILNDEVPIYISSGKGRIKLVFKKDNIKTIGNYSYDEYLHAINKVTAVLTSDEEKAFESSYEEALHLVAQKRGLDFTEEIEKKVINRDELSEYLRFKVTMEYTEKELENEQKLYTKLGILEPDIDYKSAMVDSSTQNIAAFYAPDENKIYFMKDTHSLIVPVLPSEVMLHELTHALQDQHFSLDTISQENRSLSMDRVLARESVLEGEAVFVSYDILLDYLKKFSTRFEREQLEQFDYQQYILESMLSASKNYFDKDSIFLEVMLFPYVRGTMFVKYAYMTGGWEKVNGIYKELPLSSEQILHPDKYFLLKENPLPLKKPVLHELAHTTEIASGTLGEFYLYIIGKRFLDELFANMLSEGWGNDYFFLFEQKGNLLFIEYSLWDSEKDTKEFFLGYKEILKMKYPDVTLNEFTDHYHGSNEHDEVYVGRSGHHVLILESEFKNTLLLNQIIHPLGFPEIKM